MKYFFIKGEELEKKKRINNIPNTKNTDPIKPRVKSLGLYGDCGVDFFSPVDVTIGSGEMKIIDTFVGLKLDVTTGALLFPRGGDNHLLGAGVIDTGYSGSIMFKVFNPLSHTIVIKRGDSVGQAVPFIKPYATGIELEEVSNGWGNTDRGSTGRIVSQIES